MIETREMEMVKRLHGMEENELKGVKKQEGRMTRGAIDEGGEENSIREKEEKEKQG